MRKWPAQVGTVVANVGRELSLLKMAINMENADYLSFLERTGAPLPTAASGVPGVRVNIDSGNGLLHDSTRPLPEPMLICHMWDLVAFT